MILHEFIVRQTKITTGMSRKGDRVAKNAHSHFLQYLHIFIFKYLNMSRENFRNFRARESIRARGGLSTCHNRLPGSTITLDLVRFA